MCATEARHLNRINIFYVRKSNRQNTFFFLNCLHNIWSKKKLKKKDYTDKENKSNKFVSVESKSN